MTDGKATIFPIQHGDFDSCLDPAEVRQTDGVTSTDALALQ